MPEGPNSAYDVGRGLSQAFTSGGCFCPLFRLVGKVGRRRHIPCAEGAVGKKYAAGGNRRKDCRQNSRPAAERGSDPLESKGKRTPACASALDAALLLERQKLCIAVKSTEVHQNSALPTVRGCSSTSRMLLTPVRYITIRSKPRPKPACLQEP